MSFFTSIQLQSIRFLAATVAFAVVAVGPATANPLTFAQYVQTNGAQQEWSLSTTGGVTTVSASGSVAFTFSGVAGLPFAGAESAIFTLQATSTQIGNCGATCANTDTYVQQGYSGTFSFIDNGANPGANLLSGTFAVSAVPSTSGAQLSSTIGGTGGSFNASSTAGNPNQLVLTSQYINFAGQTQETASWSLSSLIPNFFVGQVTAGQAYPGTQFNASGSGTFSSNPATVTPEPASMALMGSALIGLSLLLRRKLVRV